MSHHVEWGTYSITCFVAVAAGVCHNFAVAVFLITWRSPTIVKILGTEQVIEGAPRGNAFYTLHAEGVGKIKVRNEMALQHHAHIVVAIFFLAHIIVKTCVRQALFAYILTRKGCTETAIIKCKDVVKDKIGRER